MDISKTHTSRWINEEMNKPHIKYGANNYLKQCVTSLILEK